MIKLMSTSITSSLNDTSDCYYDSSIESIANEFTIPMLAILEFFGREFKRKYVKGAPQGDAHLTEEREQRNPFTQYQQRPHRDVQIFDHGSTKIYESSFPKTIKFFFTFICVVPFWLLGISYVAALSYEK